jgi:hypothetical protein
MLETPLTGFTWTPANIPTVPLHLIDRHEISLQTFISTMQIHCKPINLLLECFIINIINVRELEMTTTGIEHFPPL